MTYDSEFYIYVSIVSFAFVSGLRKLVLVDHSAKVIVFLLLIILIGEIFDFYFAHRFKNNMPVYHVFTIIHLNVITYYFYKVNSLPLKGFWIATTTFSVLSVINTMFIQPIKTLNSNFLLFESFLVLAMCMYSLYKILVNDLISNVSKHIHFGLLSLLLLLNSSTYFYWGFFLALYKTKWSGWETVSMMHWIINLIVYSGIGLVFLFVPKAKEL